MFMRRRARPLGRKDLFPDLISDPSATAYFLNRT
jgi:hypothetical protein